jgi:hypothetical protein
VILNTNEILPGFDVIAKDGRVGAVEQVSQTIQTFDYGQRAPYLIVRSQIASKGRFFIPLKKVTRVADGQVWVDLTTEELSRDEFWESPPSDIPS